MAPTPVPTAVAASPRETRLRWKEIQRQGPQDAPGAPRLKIALLASYTVDPLIPYLGVALRDAGLHPVLQTSPYNQIVQECLNDASGTASFAPDVLVVSPRLEELWAGRSFPERPDSGSGGPAGAVDDLLDVLDTALAAAARWNSALLVVLPPVPDDLLAVVGDDNHPGGLAAAAAAAREHVRARVVGEPNAYVVDLEGVLRSVGTTRAHHPALYAHAKIPYTEEVFAALGARIGRTLRLRFGDAGRAVALDLGSLAEDATEADALVPLVRRLNAGGIPVHVRGDRSTVRLWRALVTADCPLPSMVADWVFDDRPVPEQIRAIAAREGVPAGQVVLVGRDPAVLTAPAGQPPAPARAGSPLALGPDPDHWTAELTAAALFDRLPEPAAGPGAGPGAAMFAADRPRTSSGGLSLDSFVADLRAEVEFSAARDTHVEKIAEMMFRTKDFTLGAVLEREQLTAALADEEREVFVGTVRDRFGDFGLSVAVVLRFAAALCTVEALLVSCPVMGKGVEEAVLHRIADLAADRGCATIRVDYRTTGRNQVAVDFFASARDRHWGAPDAPAPVIDPVPVS